MTEIVWSPDTLDFEAAKKAQSDAARPTQSAWVEANAGSGKTKVLIDRVARLLLRQPDGRPGAAPDSILCITYTKAAANEMLARLFSRLGDWAVASDEMKLNRCQSVLALLRLRPLYWMPLTHQSTIKSLSPLRVVPMERLTSIQPLA